MYLTKPFTLVFFVFLPLFSLAQLTGKSQSQKSSEAKVIPKQYYEGELLAIEANAQLNKGEVKKAYSLIRQSIKTYPTKGVYEYAKSLYRISDAKTANELMTLAFNQLDQLPFASIFVQDQAPLEYIDGKPIYSITEKDLSRAKMIFGTQAFLVSQEFGDHPKMIQVLESLVALNLNNEGNFFRGDIEYMQLNNFRWRLSMEKKEYSKAIDQINTIPKSVSMNNNVRNIFLAEVYFHAEDFINTQKCLNKLTGTYSSEKDLVNFKIFAETGRNEEAMSSLAKYETFLKKIFPNGYVNNETFYYLAVIDLNKKNYQNALKNLDSALNHKNIVGNSDLTFFFDRWKIYKLMGDAYTGLEQYEKAKDAYTISLLSYPEYKPTQQAILKLESLIATTITTDKTAPEIKITEPAVNRGLEIVASGNDILIKGFAIDPSGLKSVSINGLSVYAQPTGDFWGNIPLKVGLNRITVIAIDGAGNKAETTFELVQKTNSAASKIVPATTKEGKNYCLLIGAQNYEDLNIPSLENPIQDAVKLKLILKKDYDFEDGNIFNLFNPSANDVKRQLLELTTVIQPEDNLLIFYAGHGIWVEKEKKGYWLLVDAKRNDSNTWLQNKDVLNLIAKLPSRHTLLITDACFSGGVFKTRSIGKNAPAALKTMDEKISRVAITSGNDTEVPDESVFMKYLVKALTDNKEKYLTAQKMFINQIMEAVMTETKTEPRYGTLELAGHVGGDYIFAKK
jgi:tetratricopeptide (TPR) repeat protein